MHRAYFETQFATPDTDSHWPAAFAIITAHATTGETWSEEENRAADARLAAVLRERGVWRRRLTGFSLQTGHAEPGWACALAFEDACDLGQQFKQDAIYYVEGDVLTVSYCDARRRQEPVGHFRERLSNE
jgi:Protein of unknown function (DUF3293)